MRLVECLNGIHFSEGGVGRGIQTSRFLYLTFPAPAPLFLASSLQPSFVDNKILRIVA